jgi:uncharacterized protein YcbK (DUF882 family)
MNWMKKHKYFELDELLASDVAKKKKIDNTPTFEVVANLEELVENILDPLRAAYGMPIKVTSGYRCAELNKAVGGVVGSVHQLGHAADLQVGGSFSKFKTFVVEWLKKSGVRFDQCLLERNTKTGAQWIHIATRNALGQQRGQIKVLNV